MLPSNLTLDELVRMGAVPESLLPIIERWQSDQQSAIDDDVEKENERLYEQVYFAKSLIEVIERTANETTRMAEFRKTFRRLLDDTSFER